MDKNIHDLIPEILEGSTCELVRCLIKKPCVVSVKRGDKIESNELDVIRCFKSEMRFFDTVKDHECLINRIGIMHGDNLILEYYPSRTLWDIIENGIDITKFKYSWYQQLQKAVTHIHSFNLSHGDISPVNILVGLQNSNIKLCDFGRSALKGEKVIISSPPYMAPDALKSHNGLICDIYSVGVILLSMIRDEIYKSYSFLPLVGKEAVLGNMLCDESERISSVPDFDEQLFTECNKLM